VKRKSLLVLVGAILVAIIVAVVLEYAPYGRSVKALIRRNPMAAALTARCPEPVEGKYIVVLKRDKEILPLSTDAQVPPMTQGGERLGKVADDIANLYGFPLSKVYENVLGGFSARIPDSVLTLVVLDPRVDFVVTNCNL